MQTMSRIFKAYHAYYPYDPSLCEDLNQTSYYYWHMCASYKSKHGKGGKDHVIQTFWCESKSEILSCLILSSLFEERISL
jgi:hypothetical protein